MSAVDMGLEYRLGANGTQRTAAFQTLLAGAAVARADEVRGAGPQAFKLFPETIDQARAAARAYGAEGFEYYCASRAPFERATALAMAKR